MAEYEGRNLGSDDEKGFLTLAALGAFLYLKLTTDPLVVGVSLRGMALIFAAE